MKPELPCRRCRAPYFNVTYEFRTLTARGWCEECEELHEWMSFGDPETMRQEMMREPF